MQYPQANYLRDPVGVRQPPLNGVEIVEHRESMSITICTAFADPTDLAIAREIVTVCSRRQIHSIPM